MSIDLQQSIAEHREALDALAASGEVLEQAVALLRDTLNAGATVYACGNGGSAADAQHFAAELTGRFERDRRGYPAVALTTDTSALTSIGNDYGFDHIFSRQLEAMARAGDLLLAISTSGNSPNVVQAVESARARDVRVIGLLGRDGGKLAGMADVALNIPVQRTARIQEMHIFVLHLLCEAIDEQSQPPR